MSVTFLTDEDKNKLEQDISKISGDLTELESNVSNLSQNKADKTDLTNPFNFKGSTTYAELPTTGNTINDTYYCTDLKRRYTWNGTAWYPSSLDESEYTDELSKLSEDIVTKASAIKEKASGEVIVVTDSDETKPLGLAIDGKSTQDGEPTPDNPIEIVNIGKYDEASGKYAVEVKCTGKNLLKYPYAFTTLTIDGITYTDNGDGSITINGTATNDTYFGIVRNSDGQRQAIKKGKYIISANALQDCRLNTTFIKNGVAITSVSLGTTENKLIDIPEDCEMYMNISVGNGKSISNHTIYPMLRYAEITDDTYEPYKETTATVLLDEPLRGLPVSSDGNYVDSNGQQYVVDELNSVDKKRISRINRLKLTPEQEWVYVPTPTYGNHNFQIKKLPNKKNGSIYPPYIRAFKSTHFSFLNEMFDTPNLKEPKVYVYDMEITASFPPNSDMNTLGKWKEFLANNDVYAEYILKEPITEEIDINLGELSMFYPTTIISNDCNANMEVTYIADTKAYVDKKITEVITAML